MGMGNATAAAQPASDQAAPPASSTAPTAPPPPPAVWESSAIASSEQMRLLGKWTAGIATGGAWRKCYSKSRDGGGPVNPAPSCRFFPVFLERAGRSAERVHAVLTSLRVCKVRGTCFNTAPSCVCSDSPTKFNKLCDKYKETVVLLSTPTGQIIGGTVSTQCQSRLGTPPGNLEPRPTHLPCVSLRVRVRATGYDALGLAAGGLQADQQPQSVPILAHTQRHHPAGIERSQLW